MRGKNIVCVYVYIYRIDIYRTTLEKELRRIINDKIINDKRIRWGDLLTNVEKGLWCMWIWRLFQICIKRKGRGGCVEGENKRRLKGDFWRGGKEEKVWRKGIYEVLWLKPCMYCSVLPKASITQWRTNCNGVQTKCTPLLEQCCKPPEILQLLPVASLMSRDYFINQALKHNRVERVGAFYKDEIEF